MQEKLALWTQLESYPDLAGLQLWEVIRDSA